VPQGARRSRSWSSASLLQERHTIASCSMSFAFSVMIHLTSDVEPVVFNLIDQRRAGNAELLGRPRAVAAVEPKRLLDVHPLHLGERLGLVAPSPPTPPTPPTPLTPISATPRSPPPPAARPHPP